MRDRRRATALVALLALLAALTLMAAGCGGSDEAGSDDTAIETTTDETTEDDTTTDETETTDETDTTEDSDVSAFASEDCLELASIGTKLSEALSASGGTGDFDATATYFEQLVDKAPDEIKDDLATIAGAWEEIAEALGDVDLSSGGTPSAEDLQALQELGTRLSTTELTQASENIAAWATENCTTG